MRNRPEPGEPHRNKLYSLSVKSRRFKSALATSRESTLYVPSSMACFMRRHFRTRSASHSIFRVVILRGRGDLFTVVSTEGRYVVFFKAVFSMIATASSVKYYCFNSLISLHSIARSDNQFTFKYEQAILTQGIQTASSGKNLIFFFQKFAHFCANKIGSDFNGLRTWPPKPPKTSTPTAAD